MKIYNKEVCRYTKENMESGEIAYQCLICDFKIDLSHITPTAHILLIEDHFDLKFKENVNKNLTINVKKSIEDKFIDIIFTLDAKVKNAFYNDLYFKKLFSNAILKNQKESKNYKYTILIIDASREIDNIITKKLQLIIY